VGFEFEPDDVLVVVDVINDFDHDDGDALLASFRERLEGMTASIGAARGSGIPVVYVNDAHGRWDADAPALVRDVLEDARARDVVRPIAPANGDRVLLKHRYSGFDHTPLDLLVGELGATRLVLMGAATEGCVVQTAIDAREHGLKATILADACATTSAELEEVALRYAADVGGVRVARVNGA
jgi:nicotinamidase-related amidase